MCSSLLFSVNFSISYLLELAASVCPASGWWAAGGWERPLDGVPSSELGGQSEPQRACENALGVSSRKVFASGSSSSNERGPSLEPSLVLVSP